MLPANPVLKLLTVFESQTDIAAFCHVDRSAITYWKNKGVIPAWHVKALSAYTSIPEWELCPKSFVRVLPTP